MDISLSSLLRSPLESFLLHRLTDLMRGGCTRAGSLRLRFFLKMCATDYALEHASVVTGFM